MDRKKYLSKVPLRNKAAPKKLIVDDRNKHWRCQKSYNPVADQQAYEYSHIPLEKKLQYAKRYFKDHCHDCYCRDPLVSPTSKYLYQEDNSSDNEENLTCSCPLKHPCEACILSRETDVEEDRESLAPFLSSKRRHGPTVCQRRKNISTSSEECYCERRHFGTDSDKTSCDQFRGRRPASTDEGSCYGRRYSEMRKKSIKSQEIVQDDSKCSGDSNRTRRSSKLKFLGNLGIESGLNYTKRRDKYEIHKVSKKCGKGSSKHGKTVAPEELSNTDHAVDASGVSDFRDQFYFDTHDPFVKGLQTPEIHSSHSSAAKKTSNVVPEGYTSIEIDRRRYSKEDSGGPKTSCHRCVYSFQLNGRLQPIPLNADAFGRSCCDECGQVMRTVGSDELDGLRKTTEGADGGNKKELTKESGASCRIGTTCAVGCKSQMQDECSKLCPALEPQRVHIGCGNERIKLTIPNDLLEDSIGHSAEVALSRVVPMSGMSKGSKAGGRAGQVTERGSWNSANKGKVNPLERPNSFALRFQKFSMYNR